MNTVSDNLHASPGVPKSGLPPFVRQPTTRRIFGFCFFAATYYFAFRYGMSFSQERASPFWFPDSVLLCALLLNRPGRWWIFVVATLPIRFLVALPLDLPVWFLLGTFAIDSAKSLLAAAVLRRFLRNPVRLETLREFAAFCLVAVLLIPAASAFAGATLRHLLGYAYWTAWEQWFMGNALTHLVITPAIFYLVLGLSWKVPAPSPKRFLEGVVLTAGLIVTGYMALSTAPSEIAFAEPRFFAPVPFLFWAAIRFGMFGASGAITILALLSVEAALQGRGPFAGESPARTALALQQFLLLRAAPLYLVAILIEQNKDDQRSLRQSEALNRGIINSLTSLVVLIDRSGKIIAANDAWRKSYRLGGVPTPGIDVGVNYLEVCRRAARAGDEIVGEALTGIEDVLTGKEGEFKNEYACVTPAGALWFEMLVLPLRSEAGGAVVSHTDITKRKTAEMALRQSDERMSLAAESANLSFWTMDFEHGKSWMSEKGRELFGFTPNEILTRDSFFSRVHPEDKKAVELAIAETRASTERFEFEFRISRPDGETRWLIARGRYLRNDRDEISDLMGVAIDVTTQVKTNVELRLQREEMTRLSRVALLGQLTASLAHELNQPLTAIASNAAAGKRFLARGAPDIAMFEELLDDVFADARRAGDIINGIHHLVRKGGENRRVIRLNEVILEVLRLLHSDLLGRATTVETQLDPDLAPIEADPVHLQQVLLNLIMNALEAMQQTPPAARRIFISTSGENGFIEVSVRDHGAGLPPNDPNKVFAQFFSTKPEGMGMGLTIVRSIVKAHGGELGAEDLNDGARFFFRLPSLGH